jgi:hypothetical protein
MEEKPTTEELIRHLEERLLRADVRRSVLSVAELLADDFVEIGSSGRIFDKSATIAGLQSEPHVEISLTDYQARILAPDVILATYRAVRSPRAPAQPTQSLRSSIWKRRDGRWQLVFHQGTPLLKRH